MSLLKQIALHEARFYVYNSPTQKTSFHYPMAKFPSQQNRYTLRCLAKSQLKLGWKDMSLKQLRKKSCSFGLRVLNSSLIDFFLPLYDI